jgi:hypothetical protein
MAEQIPLAHLVKGRWYVGRGRNGNVGYWDGDRFLVIAEKCDEYVIKQEPYYTETGGCFQPFALMDEGEMVEPFGRVGWDAHYGRRMEFGTHELGAPPAYMSADELVGAWKASSYFRDGRRIELTLILKPLGEFEYRSSVSSDPSSGEQVHTGKWELRQQERLLQLRSETGPRTNSVDAYHILHYGETTLMLHWVALASRNLPVLYYRVGSAQRERS